MSVLNGRELLAMDRGGTSDPYVRVLQVTSPAARPPVHQGDEELHRTPEKKKTVNPVWNNQSNVYIESPLNPLTFQVNTNHLAT